MHVGRPHDARPAEIDEQPAREHRRRLRDVRVDTLLPAVRALGPQAEPLRGAQDPDRLEVRGLQQDLGRVVADLGVETTHDRRERHRTLAVGDQQVRRQQLAVRAVERAQLLPLAGASHDDPPTGELRPVEGVERASLDVHHVVRDVDDVRDRAHAGEVEAAAQPLG